MDAKEKLNKLIAEIMAEAEKDGEPVTREEAEEMALMEMGAKEIKRNERTIDPKAEKKKREVKPDEKKVAFIKDLSDLLKETKMGMEVSIVNPQREISFLINGESYSLTLTKHRPPKNKGN